MQFKAIDPCFRDASPLSILSSSVLGLVLGFCGTRSSLVAMCWPFLGVETRAWLLGLCSISPAARQQTLGDVLQARTPPARKHPLGLRYQISQGEQRTSFHISLSHLLRTPGRAEWSHLQAQHLVHAAYRHILWRTVLKFCLLKLVSQN